MLQRRYCLPQIKWIMAMKKYLEVDQRPFIRSMQKRQPLPTMLVEVWLLQSWALKGHMWTQVPFKFFSSMNPFKKDHETQKVFLKDVMLFIIKGLLPWRLLNQFRSMGWRINHVHKWSFHPWIFLWKKGCLHWCRRPWLNMCNLH